MSRSENIRLVALDLDGTITQHKTKLDDINKDILIRLCKKYKLVIVGAGSCLRIYEQLNNFPVDIIGNYGMQESRVVLENNMNKFETIKDTRVDIDKEDILARVNRIRNITEYKKYKGETVEFHDSGLITFPLLGTKADLRDKLQFDPDRTKRRKIYNLVQKEFSDFTVFIGGTSSFDIAPKQFNKYIALVEYAKRLGITRDQIIYFGDDYGLGGNDEHVYKSDIKFVEVDDYSGFGECVKALFDLEISSK